MRCVGYTRKIPWKQGLDLSRYTLNKQITAVTAYINKKKGWELVGSYSDSEENNDRGFMEMQSALLEKRYDCIVFPSIYFAGGSFSHVIQRLWETLYPAGIQFAAADEDFYSGSVTPSQLAAYFEDKRRIRHHDITVGWKESLGEGFVLANSIPFGYICADGRQMIKDDELKEIVEELFRRRLRGEKAGEIAQWLNDMNVDTPDLARKKRNLKPTQGERAVWKSDMVLRLLKNPVYTGAKVNSKKEILKEGCYEAYISKKEFEQINPGKYTAPQRGEKNNAGAQKPRRGKQDRRPSVFCGCCGRALSLRLGANSAQDMYGCGCEGFGGEFSVERVEEEATKRLSEERTLARLAEEKIREGLMEKAMSKLIAEAARKMRNSLEEFKAKPQGRAKLWKELENGEITRQEYDARLADICARYRALEFKLSECMEERRRAEKAFSLKNPWIALYTCDNAFMGTRRENIRKNIKRIEALPNGELRFTMKEAVWRDKLTQFLEKEAEG